MQAEQETYEATFGRLVMPVDSVERRFTAWPEWAITTKIDISAHRQQVWNAIMCHRSQLPELHKPNRTSGKLYTRLSSTQTYYRAISMVNGGREVESDLFDGLRQRTQPQRFFFAPQPQPAQAQPVAI